MFGDPAVVVQCLWIEGNGAGFGLVTDPAINGNVTTETLASGQQLFIQTLLPLNPAASAVYAAGNLNPIAELEPTQYVYTVQDPANPADTRFLHVLQGADAGIAMAPGQLPAKHQRHGL